MSLRAADLRILRSLLRGLPEGVSHADRLQAFYGPQAEHYDSFRERLLAGRGEMIRLLAPPDGAAVVELGGGTGRNLGYFGDDLARFGSVEIVDLCPALLDRARRRWAGAANVRVVEADATSYKPQRAADCVYFSYALTMIPDWRQAIDNALAMLKPGGVLGVIDHVGVAGKDNVMLHRMLPQQARDAITKAGFTIEAESTLLANPADDHTKNVFDPSVMGHTDQFVFRARKPR